MVRPKGSIMPELAYARLYLAEYSVGRGACPPQIEWGHGPASARASYRNDPALWLFVEPETVGPIDPKVRPWFPVVEVAVGNVAQPGIDGHGLWHFAYQSDGVDLIAVNFYHLAPGGGLVGVLGRVAP